MFSVLDVWSSVCIALLVVLLIASVSVLLVVASDFAEENSSLFKRILRWTIILNAVVVIGIALTEENCVLASLLSLVTNAVYFVFLKDFPYLPFKSKVVSAGFVTLAAVVTLVQSYVWLKIMQGIYYGSVWSMLSFLIVQWTVPVLLLVSLTTVDDRFPGSHVESFKAADLIKNVNPNPPPLPSLVGIPFGTVPTANMLVIDYKNGAWGKPEIMPFQNFSLSPLTNVLHYSLSCFEGMKAYTDIKDVERVEKGEKLTEHRVRLFRPDKNIARLRNSMARLCFPDFDPEEFLKCLEEYVKVESAYVPKQYGYSLYLRPTAIAMDETLNVNCAKCVRLFTVATPVGPLYTPPPGSDPKVFRVFPVSLLVEEKAKRAWPGGTGGCKLGANYAGPILVQEEAHAKGYDQVLWLGANQEVQEVGAMNFICVWKTKDDEVELATAPLDGSVLPGVTRDSILQLVREWGEVKVSERVYYVSDMIEAIEEGRMIECFGCGTAAIVTPVKRLAYKGKEYDVPAPEDEATSIARRCLKTILEIQTGVKPHEWSRLLVSSE